VANGELYTFAEIGLDTADCRVPRAREHGRGVHHLREVLRSQASSIIAAGFFERQR
jgi:hypothetical protein